MYITHSRSRTGKIYSYFFCGGRSKKRTGCTMTATRIDVVDTALEDLYRRITYTPQQSLLMQDRIMGEHLQASALEPPKFSSDELIAKREKILEAYYKDSITLQVLQSELDRFSAAQIEQHGRSFLAESAECQQDINRLRLRENAFANFEMATHDERRAMHRPLFGALILVRTNDGQVTLVPECDAD